MSGLSLNRFLKIQRLLVRLRWLINNKVWGMNISKTAVFSLSAKLDKTHPKGIYVGDFSYVAFGSSILSHDMTRRLKTNTYIGRNCFIGAKSIILPGVEIGDEVIVGAGSVVTKNIPSNSIVAGNPAKIIKSGVKLGRYGTII